MSSKLHSKEKWFWASLIEMTIPKSRMNDMSAQTEVWDNLVLIRAKGANEALRKALKIGKAASGDCRGTLRLYGRPATTQFLGIADIGLIHDDLTDGAEILWELKRCSQKKARSLAASRNELLRRLKDALLKD